MVIRSFLNQQLGNTGNIYWNWCTDNLWPWQGHYVNGSATPWCAEFVTCMLEWTNSKCVYFPNSCAFDRRDIPIEQRYYAQSIRPLDIISFDWDKDKGGDHVGIVLNVYDWGCRTIEGNSDVVVRERDRYWDDILFGIRPDWGEEVTEEDYENIANRVVEKLSNDNGSGMSLIGGLIWGAINRDLESRDAYQILRDIRNTLGIYDGQKYPSEVSKKYSAFFDQGPIKPIFDAANKYLDTNKKE